VRWAIGGYDPRAIAGAQAELEAMNPKLMATGPWLRRAARAAAALLVASFALTCSAQTDPDEDAPDPPGRVGRLSILTGTATLTDMSSGQSQQVLANWPITSEQNLATDAGSRAEVQIGSLALRLDGATEVDFVRIDDETIELVVQRGAVTLHVRNRDTLAAIDLTTPRERIVLDDVGRYRLDVDRIPGLTSLTVNTGYARILTGSTTFSVAGGQRADVSGEPTARFQVVAPLADAFDDWVAPLDRRDDALRSGRYLSSETTGIESLDDYGQWRTVPEYGQIWYPGYVQAGWVPYRFGRWIWVAPWGWTWVDEAPWGFAPFHYGRWVYLNGQWAWLPGAYVARPIYAPCLVAWYGGAGPVGWFPLGPGDIYVPGYRASRHYVEALNFQHLRQGAPASRGDAQPHYVYQRNPTAVTWVDPDAMARHRPVGRALRPPPSQWNSVPVTRVAPVAAEPPRAIQRRSDRDVATGDSRTRRSAPSEIDPLHGQETGGTRAVATPSAPIRPIHPTTGQVLVPAPRVEAQGGVPSPAIPVRRPASPTPPTVGGEPGRRGPEVERPIPRVDRPVPQPAPPVTPSAPQVSAAPASAPVSAEPERARAVPR
jgi:hypothetical protein